MGEVLAFTPSGADDEQDDVGNGLAKALAARSEIEALRRRLARVVLDVHDGPMQDLVALSWRLRSQRALAVKEAGREEPPGSSAVFEGVAADLVRLEIGLRALMLSLETDAAPPRSLRVPVDEHVAVFKHRSTAHVDVTISGDVEPRTDSQRIALERVLREALSNIAKHAHAEHVAITMRGTADSIVLEIRDDGRGFAPDAHRGPQHIGLRAIPELLRMLGGRFAIDSRIGGPTIVTAEINKWQPAGKRDRGYADAHAPH